MVGVPKDQDPNQLGGGRAEFRVEMTKAAAEMAAAAAPPVPFARWAKLFRAVELEFDFGSVQEVCVCVCACGGVSVCARFVCLSVWP